MPMMHGDLYDALLEAGASEAKARKGAEAVANYDQRFTNLEGKIDTRFATVEGKIDTLRAEVKGEMAWMRWMMGTSIVVTLGILWKILIL